MNLNTVTINLGKDLNRVIIEYSDFLKLDLSDTIKCLLKIAINKLNEDQKKFAKRITHVDLNPNDKVAAKNLK